jgi:hypothetical protein
VTPEPPAFWHLMLRELFQVRSAKLRAALWHAYPASMALRFALERCGERAPSDLAAIERVRHLAGLIEPKYLLVAAEKLVKPGQTRPPELRQFEQKVLAIIDRDGHWIWSHPQGATR